MKTTLLTLLLAAAALPPLAASEPSHEGLAPRQVLWRLRQGNHAYVSGKLSTAAAMPAKRAALVASQHPNAVILTCADSRVPPELIFNEGLGKLFVVRVAGVVADPVVVGSVEYAAEHLHTPLVVVMGHTRCGAVKAAIDTKTPIATGDPQANIGAIINYLKPGLPKGEWEGDPWRAAVYGGVEQSIEDMMHSSKILPEMGKAGHLDVVGAVYELESGKVVFSDPVSFEEAEHAAADTRLVHWKNLKLAASAKKRD